MFTHLYTFNQKSVGFTRPDIKCSHLNYPLQAYLTGRISASGDVKKLMFFDKISSRGHKQGSMFSI